MMLHEKKQGTLAVLLFVILLSLFAVIGAILLRYEFQQHRQQEMESVQQVINTRGAALRNRLYFNLHKVEGVKALVAMNPDLTQEDFSRAMQMQFRGEHDLRNIGLAREMVLELMYPVEGNEAAIGIDYTKLPQQLPAVNLALKLNKTVLAGPLDLVQGGQGIIARIPIYIENPLHYPEGFWGFASVVMKSDAIFQGAGITPEEEGARLAIRGRDASGAGGEVFFGDPQVFENLPVTQVIELPYGSWQMGAIPVAGWSEYDLSVTPLITIYLVAVALILVFNGVIYRLFQRMRKAQKALMESRHDLERAIMSANNANNAKSRYLEHMNHEIRTPLNGFVGFLNLMEETRLDEEQQMYMLHMKQSTSHMLSIINNVLDMAKIEASEMQLSNRTFDLEEEIMTAVAPLHSLAKQQKSQLLLKVADNIPRRVKGDPDRLRQILLNLGGNAVKFTHGGQISINIQCLETTGEKHTLQLVVEDTGPGMTQETQERLFQPFYQADDGSTIQSKGTGLGMTITQELVELMDGHIQLESTLGKGTRVEVCLMLNKVKDL